MSRCVNRKRNVYVAVAGLISISVPAWLEAGARVDLRPASGQFVTPFQETAVDVYLVDTGTPQGDILFREIQFGFMDTSGTLTFPTGQFTWALPAQLYVTFPTLPVTLAVWPLPSPNPNSMYRLPDNGEVKVGSVLVNVGSDGGTLDVMNADEPNQNFGANTVFGFSSLLSDPVTIWRAFTGELTGGSLDLIVGPPPTDACCPAMGNCVSVASMAECSALGGLYSPGLACGDADADGCEDICDDSCPGDPMKCTPGVCGCGVDDTDSDLDGVADCLEECDNDPNKTTPAHCGGGGGQDVCANSTEVFDGATPFSTIGATTDGSPNPLCTDVGGSSQVTQDIWFHYTATCDGTLIVNTCGSRYDSKLAVYETNACVGSIVGCNDDTCGFQSTVTGDAVLGQTYKIRVGGYMAAVGSGTLNVACAVSAGNDNCEDATGVTDGTYSFNTLGATTDGLGDALCIDVAGSYQVNQDIWFDYSATCSGNLTAALCGSGYDTTLALYEGGGCVGRILACNDDFCGLQSTVTAQVDRGCIYKIRAGGYLQAAGTGVISITCSCGVPDFDSDGDGVPDCDDICPGFDDAIDANGDGEPDCVPLDGSCCLPGGGCVFLIFESECNALGGCFSGGLCLGDHNGNGVDDLCDTVCPIPTVSQWGLVVLGLLLLTGGKVYFGRRQNRRAIPAEARGQVGVTHWASSLLVAVSLSFSSYAKQSDNR